MSGDNLTPEQESVIYHPRGKHARVLAVAGSGKTTTMVYRIKYLVTEQGVTPDNIRVLMFNRLARKQFKEKLTEVGLPFNLQPQVHTFHSFSYQFISEMIATGLLPGQIDIWVEDKAELVRIYVHRAINNLVSRKRIPPDSVDPDDAIEAIGLWKGSLIPPLPSRAGYHGNRYMPLVYEEFEKLRIQQNALTYDDFIPMAVGILETEHAVNQKWCNRADFVIVDEYQDVNYGQQRLVELLAGQHADVMVVGDDDQTIYEWRGARPNYILGEFRNVFANKPHVDYKLSRSFRFGPVIAQCAQNVIDFNTNRNTKPLIAHSTDRVAHIHVINNSSEQSTDANKELAQQAVALVRECKDPRKIIVLVRMFAQLIGLESEFLASGIPYRVVGRAPFFERREIRVLLDYINLAVSLDEPVTRWSGNLLLSVANTPNRKLQRDILSDAIEAVRLQGGTIKRVLRELAESPDTPFNKSQRERIDDLLARLERLRERVTQETNLLAGHLLYWLVASLNYLKHFDDYYGKGESSEDRKRAVVLFYGYAQSTGLPILDFVHLVEKLDPTRGEPEEKQIVMTTVFRTKGLEYDFVIIPNCEEGYIPCLFGTGNLVYDKAGIVQEPVPSEIIENERRLFYVAVTRAKKGVFIGTSSPPAQGSQSNSSPSRPSRFLCEMQLEPTVAVMSAFQRLSLGIAEARTDLLVSIRKFGGVKKVIRNLVSEYLPSFGDNGLAYEVQSLVTRIPESPFVYPATYATPSVMSYKSEPPEPQWWDEDRLDY